MLAPDPRKREGFAEGAFVVQEEGAQAIALSLAARRGERILDACAGRGQKTSLFAEQVGAAGAVWATDVYPKKLDALQADFERLRLPLAQLRAVDWTVGVGDVPADFDRVLVDAPCTGAVIVNYINQLAAEGITGGCGGGNYCPSFSVTRAQMAVLLVETFSLQ